MSERVCMSVCALECDSACAYESVCSLTLVQIFSVCCNLRLTIFVVFFFFFDVVVIFIVAGCCCFFILLNEDEPTDDEQTDKWTQRLIVLLR